MVLIYTILALASFTFTSEENNTANDKQISTADGPRYIAKNN